MPVTITVSARDAVNATASTTVVATQQAASGYPDATNTGVPSGTSLTVVNGNLTSSAANQIIDAQDVRGLIIVRHTNVTIKRCKAYFIYDAGAYDGTGSALGAGMIVQDTTINPPTGNTGGNSGVSIWGGNGSKVLRCSISNVENGIWLEAHDVTVQDNWFHNFIPYTPQTDPHIDGVQIPNDGSPNNILRPHIVHNNFDFNPSTGVSSCCTVGAAATILIDSNRFIGEIYALYINGGTTGSITNNLFVHGDIDKTGSGVVTYSGNVDSNGNPKT